MVSQSVVSATSTPVIASAKPVNQAMPKTEGTITPPMPGKIVSINVNIGDTVTKGTVLLILEAMKMQNEIKAPRAGTVTAIHVNPGDLVSTGDPMIVIE